MRVGMPYMQQTWLGLECVVYETFIQRLDQRFEYTQSELFYLCGSNFPPSSQRSPTFDVILSQLVVPVSSR